MLGQCTPYGFIIKLVIIFSLAAVSVTITQLFTSNSIISLIVFQSLMVVLRISILKLKIVKYNNL